MTVPAEALALMRSESQRLAPESWSLTRPDTTPDGQGGQTVTYTTVASGSAAAGTGARIASPGYQANEREIGQRTGSAQYWQIALPVGTDVRLTDRVILGGRTFEVIGVGGPRTWAAFLPVSAVEVL